MSESETLVSGALRKVVISVIAGIVLMAISGGITGYYGMQLALAEVRGQLDAMGVEIANLKASDVRHERDIRELRGATR